MKKIKNTTSNKLNGMNKNVDHGTRAVVAERTKRMMGAKAKKDDLNLNELKIAVDDFDLRYTDNMHDFSTVSGDTEVVFRNIKEKCLNFINSYDVIVGSIAWLTDNDILDAMSKKKRLQIVVQKEDFLRPDYGSNIRTQQKELRDRYNMLANLGGERMEYHSPVRDLSMGADPVLEGIRCLGHNNSDRVQAKPRAHNKFIVGCNWRVGRCRNDHGPYCFRDGCKPKPVAAWTGSFNFTNNASRSFENAVIIKNSTIANAFYQEWMQLVCLSEPLDWETPWCSPQWRIGT